MPGCRDRQRPDRARPRHQDPFLEERSDPLERMQDDREGLAECQLLEGHMARRRLALRGVADETLSKGAVHVGKQHRATVEAHPLAMVRQAFEAVAAGPARAARIDRHAIAHP